MRTSAPTQRRVEEVARAAENDVDCFVVKPQAKQEPSLVMKVHALIAGSRRKKVWGPGDAMKSLGVNVREVKPAFTALVQAGFLSFNRKSYKYTVADPNAAIPAEPMSSPSGPATVASNPKQSPLLRHVAPSVKPSGQEVPANGRPGKRKRFAQSSKEKNGASSKTGTVGEPAANEMLSHSQQMSFSQESLATRSRKRLSVIREPLHQKSSF